MGDLMRRATRTAQSSPLGPQLISFVNRLDVQTALKGAAEEGIPPVMAVSELAMSAFPPGTFDDDMTKRRLGLLISAVLDEAGFEPARSNVRIRNSLFASGSIYKKKRVAPLDPTDFVTRLIGVLTEEEADRLIYGLIDRFPSLKNKIRR